MANNISWPQDIQEKFEKLIAKIPLVLRGFAKDKVSKRAKSLVVKDHRIEVTEKDLVDAFFAETPFGFQGPLKTDMEEIGVDYRKYGHGESPADAFKIKYKK